MASRFREARLGCCLSVPDAGKLFRVSERTQAPPALATAAPVLVPSSYPVVSPGISAANPTIRSITPLPAGGVNVRAARAANPPSSNTGVNFDTQAVAL